MILPTKEEVKLCNIIDSSDSIEEEKKIAEKSSFEIRKEKSKRNGWSWSWTVLKTV